MSTDDVTRVSFRSGEEKSRYLDAKCSLDARIPAVREFALRIARTRDPNRADLRAKDFHRFVRDNIRYVPDPFDEEFADASTILQRAAGDCDDKARLFVALCRAVGIESRIRPVFTGKEFTHVQAEVKWPMSDRDPNAQPNGWIVVELILKNLPLGADIDEVPRLPDGRRELA